MAQIEVRISLDRIGSQIVWTVDNEDSLPALRSAVSRGEFGRAHIVDEQPSTVASRWSRMIAA